MALTPKQFKQMQEYLVAPKKKRTFAPLVPNLEKMIDLYDGPVIVDGDEIKFENQKRAELARGDVAVRKPNAVPPKTNTIQKFASGGLSRKTLLDMLKNEYPKEFNRYKNLSTKELKELLNNLDTSGVPFKKGGDVKKRKEVKEVQEPMSINIDTIKFASEPNEIELDIMQSLEQAYEEFKKRNPKFKGGYKDFLDTLSPSQLRDLTKRTSPIEGLILSSAMQKISDATSGIGGLITDGSMADAVRITDLSPEEIKLVSKMMGRKNVRG